MIVSIFLRYNSTSIPTITHDHTSTPEHTTNSILTLNRIPIYNQASTILIPISSNPISIAAFKAL